MKIKFKRSLLVDELDLPGNALKSEIVEQDRWSTTIEIIFNYEGKFYRTWYSRGSTEYQDVPLWDEDEVECEEVHKVEKVLEVWEAV